MTSLQSCRHCNAPLSDRILDLGFAPPSNAYLSKDELSQAEVTLPLRLLLCTDCWLVQTEDFTEAEQLFASDYAYFSSTSSSWLEHARKYAAKVVDRFGLNANSHVMEVASNDGYLLKNFVERGIPCVGVEPTKITAEAARSKGIQVEEEFFGLQFAKQLEQTYGQSDLVIGNNVYAHVPQINDFTAGLASSLKPNGVVTLEFPHILNLLKFNQFDTVYHEHYSYLSLHTVKTIFESHGLRIFDCEKLPTHGGSIRVFGCRAMSEIRTERNVDDVLGEEARFGIKDAATYYRLQQSADDIKYDFLEFLIAEKRAGRFVAAFGAAAKGNTLMNYAGVKPDLIKFVCDNASAKQNKFCPGSHVPILSSDALKTSPVDTVVIFPWNIFDELSETVQSLVDRPVRLAAAVPNLRITEL